MGVRNLRVGGKSGYSGGKVNRALRIPPSLSNRVVNFQPLPLGDHRASDDGGRSADNGGGEAAAADSLKGIGGATRRRLMSWSSGV